MIESNVRAIALHQELPDDSVFAGGDFQVYAVQARYALNERWALIATKDGHIDFNPAGAPDDEGMADIAAGFKFAAIDDPDAGLLVTPGLVFETALGGEEVFQGNGDGVLRPFVSAGWDRGEWNFLGAVGYNLPLDSDAESSSLDYHVHVDYEVTPEFFPLVEVNAITYTGDGDALAVDFEGGDLINLGATDVSGNTRVTAALGGRYKFQENLQLGLVYELPLGSDEDLFDSRITLDLLWYF